MTIKSDFTPEEWQLVFSAAPMVGMAVAAASPSGPIGLMKEMFAVGTTIADTLNQKTSNPLIGALIDDIKARGTRPAPPAGVSTPEQARTAALDSLKQLNALIARKIPGAEGDEFKRWLAGIGQRVAEASNEGGFLGFGGTRVSDAEKATIAQIAETLGVPPPAAHA
jgi:hypothetical protein